MKCNDNNNNKYNGHSIRKIYYRNMQNISEGDLKLVEKDMAFYEKVSLSFLLFGGNKLNAQYALQRLLVINNRNDESDILYCYSKSISNWREPLIEALVIIGANKILRKLGFSSSDLKIIFLPHIPEVSLHIHPLLKALFFMCERLDPAEAGRLIFKVDINETRNFLRFYESCMLEVYLLDWLTKDIITIGDMPSTADSPPKLDLIIQFLKAEEMDSLKDMLLNVISDLYKSKENNDPRTSFNEIDSASFKNENFKKKYTFEFNHDDQYFIRKEWAGFIVIFNQKTFVRDSNPELKDQLSEIPLKPRRGTDVDRDKLKTSFASFGYMPVVIDDCSHIEMKYHITDYVKRSAVFDSLIICILSHGIEGAVYGSNSVPVRIQTIQKLMASDTLLKKPKMLIVQACQGREQKKRANVSSMEKVTMEPPAAAYADMLTAVATIPGFASIRNIERGTWFILTLCQLVDQLGDRKHMLDILTSVNKQVSAMRRHDDQCMVSQSFQTLKKSFFLPKRF